MIHYDPTLISHRDFHQILLSGVAPRPIAFVSSMNSDGQVNLAPFSFFNAFASKPPVVAIGPAIAAATGREKDTLLNILQTGECTISTVSYSFVQQMNLASTDYEPGVDEFVKSGLTKASSDLVKAPYVAESFFSMECSLIQNIELFREQGGNGNIMLLKVLRVHVKEKAMTDGKIDPRKMDLVARMGYKWYARVQAEDCFEAGQPRLRGIGMDNLPSFIQQSRLLSGNDLAQLAMVEKVPEIDPQFSLETVLNTLGSIENAKQNAELTALSNSIRAAAPKLGDEDRHRLAAICCQQGHSDWAWQCLLRPE